jgi:RNA polymerase sigma-70 factor (ECF subfamily)
VAISFYRRESVRARYVISGDQHLLEIAGESERAPEDVERLYRFIEALDPLNKALMLLYLDENSYREIADVLGITETNVATRIGRLKDKLRQEFGVTGKA